MIRIVTIATYRTLLLLIFRKNKKHGWRILHLFCAHCIENQKLFINLEHENLPRGLSNCFVGYNPITSRNLMCALRMALGRIILAPTSLSGTSDQHQESDAFIFHGIGERGSNGVVSPALPALCCLSPSTFGSAQR